MGCWVVSERSSWDLCLFLSYSLHLFQRQYLSNLHCHWEVADSAATLCLYTCGWRINEKGSSKNSCSLFWCLTGCRILQPRDSSIYWLHCVNWELPFYCSKWFLLHRWKTKATFITASMQVTRLNDKRMAWGTFSSPASKGWRKSCMTKAGNHLIGVCNQVAYVCGWNWSNALHQLNKKIVELIPKQHTKLENCSEIVQTPPKRTSTEYLQKTSFTEKSCYRNSGLSYSK